MYNQQISDGHENSLWRQVRQEQHFTEDNPDHRTRTQTRVDGILMVMAVPHCIVVALSYSLFHGLLMRSPRTFERNA